MLVRLAVASFVFVAFAMQVGAADWPGWRGPGGMGQVENKNLPLKWGGKDNANVLWKALLPG